MAAEITKAAKIRAPFGDGTANSNVRLFTAETTHSTNALPEAWCGQWVTLRAVGGAVWVLVSTSSTAEVDRAVAASAAGAASPKLGIRIPNGETVQFELPTPDGSLQALYLSREADTASSTLEAWLSS